MSLEGLPSPVSLAQSNRERPLFMDVFPPIDYPGFSWNSSTRRVNAAGYISTIPSSSFLLPFDIAAVRTGGYYVSLDTCILRLYPSGSNITIAGVCGATSTTGASGPATSVVLGAPRGLAITGNGGVLFADESAHCVRLVGPSGYLSTVAGICGTYGSSADGTIATSANINRPYGVSTDARGGFAFTVRSYRRFSCTQMPARVIFF